MGRALHAPSGLVEFVGRGLAGGAAIAEPFGYPFVGLHILHVHGEVAHLVESVPNRQSKIGGGLMGNGVHMNNMLARLSQRDAVGDAFRRAPVLLSLGE